MQRSYYVGPGKDRVRLDSIGDVDEAAANGVLDETHWVELKRLLPTGKAQNAEVARDLASLSVDGGIFVVGVEDAGGKAGAVVGITADPEVVRDRIDQVSRGRIEPPLNVTTRTVADGTRTVLIVTVPRSAIGPHMVDGQYWGRGDTGKRPLADSEVRMLMLARAGASESISTRLRAIRREFDKVPVAAAQHAHIVVLVEPTSPLAAGPRLVTLLKNAHPFEIVLPALNATGLTQGYPHLGLRNHVVRDPRGIHGLSIPPDEDAVANEAALLAMLAADDGSVTLTCGRASDTWGPNDAGQERVIASLIRDLVEGGMRVAVHVGQTYLSYGGPWGVSVYIDKLLGIRASEASETMAEFRFSPYPMAEYEATTEFTADEMSDPVVVLDRLLRPLFHGLGVEHKYLP